MPKSALSFPPIYTVVGIYRLATDPTIRSPVWDKCRHGLQRGLVVAGVYAAATFHIQRGFVSLFFSKSSLLSHLISVPFLSKHFQLFNPVTWTTLVLLTSQLTSILNFFLSKNIRISRERAWDLTVASRGKKKEFWGAYAEEWQKPPTKIEDRGLLEKFFGKWWARLLFRRFVLFPLKLYPLVGQLISAWLRAYGTSRFLHSKYFALKGMSSTQVATYMKEREWDYRLFGFAAALLETAPLIGIMFTISNQIGAAMWAHDLEKRQGLFRAKVLQPLPPHIVKLEGGGTIELRPAGTGIWSAFKGQSVQSSAVGALDTPSEEQIAGAWKYD